MRMVRLLRRRRSRIVYRIRGLVPGKTAVVKCYGNWRDAVPERNIMRAYGQDRRLVRLYAWRVWGGRGYLIMEYVPGPTVNELVRKMGPLPPERVVALASDVLKGVEALHRRGIIHGDLHGDNVIVTDLARGKTKIIDFQHAVKMDRSGTARARRTLPIPPPHLAPETRQRRIDPRYDIYGVGFLCATMLAGEAARTQAQLRRWLANDSPLWRVIAVALDPDPENRFPSAAAMRRALRAAN
nr:hypothetical protein [Bacillota bacterium]